MATTPPSASWPRASARPVGSGHMCGMTGPSPGQRHRRRSITPRATVEASIHRSNWPPSPVSCKLIATTASSRCSIRRRRCCRLRRRFASPMRGGASSSWQTSRRTPGKATGANRSRRSRWRRSDASTLCSRSSAPSTARGADERRAVRQKRSKPLLDDMHTWLLRERETLSRSSEVLKPMNYMVRRWADFARFLDDGRICLTNNCAERALRGIASLEPLCAPSLSACKHWKRVRVNFARRATLSGNRCFDRLGRQIGSSNLTRRSRNNLHSRKNAAGDKAADHMT
ncbi:hypothetical protein ACVJ5M_008841 [Bradyrhizobium sp. S3.7.6]